MVLVETNLSHEQEDKLREVFAGGGRTGARCPGAASGAGGGAGAAARELSGAT